MEALKRRTICETEHVCVRDVQCRACRGAHRGPEEYDPASHIVAPYAGVFIRRLGLSRAVADVNQALFFNRAHGYRIDHPAHAGDACLSVRFSTGWLEEIGRKRIRFERGEPVFQDVQQHCPASAQVMAARLRSARSGQLLEVEELATAFARELFEAPDLTRTRRRRPAQRKLVEAAKLELQARADARCTLSELAAAVGASPVYLTQLFTQTEGMPLYKYQKKLRLAHSLAELPHSRDLTDIALAHGFSSHSQFSAAFRKLFGTSPSILRRALAKGKTP